MRNYYPSVTTFTHLFALFKVVLMRELAKNFHLLCSFSKQLTISYYEK